MVRGGGDLPRNPASLKKKSSDAAESPQKPAQLELVPEAPATPVSAADGIVITIKSNNLKESKKNRLDKGKPEVYRSVTGKDASGKTFWMEVEMDQANPQKGEQWVVAGKERKPFGQDDDPLHPIDLTSIVKYDEAVAAISAESPQVSGAPSDLLQTVAELMKQHGNYKVLQAVAEAIK
jgi:hypothetical protein